MKYFADRSSERASDGDSLLHISKPKRRRWPWVVGLALAIVILAALGVFLWYQHATSARDPAAEAKFFTVEQGDTADVIAARLYEQGFIRDELAFRIALRLNGEAASSIKLGSYQLSAAENVSSIIAKLESGKVDIATIQIIPGKTLREVREEMVKVGYEAASVDEALAADYDHPLLAAKPADATLEGYIYPDTYEVDLTASPKVLLTTSFDNFYQKLEAAGLKDARYGDLDFHEAIILGSIIEKEVNTDEDRPIVAQIFLKRLDEGIQLGSDATFVYAAREMGVPAAVDLESPYNTRVYTGLPPGPISNMTLDALQALEEPADSDFLYFVTADDNVTHYARTLAEHEANVAQHCGVRCEL